MKPRRIFSPIVINFELVNLLHEIKNSHRATVRLAELVLGRQHASHRLFQPLVLRSFVVKPDGVEVVSVFEITHSGEGDVDGAIDIAIALLHLGAEDADYFEAQSIDSNSFAEGIASREELFLCLGTDYGDARALHLILHIVETALAQFESADHVNVRVVSRDSECKSSSVELDDAILADLRCDMRDLREVRGKQIDIVHGEADLRTGLLSTRLHGTAARNQNHQLGAEVGEDVGARLAKTVAVGQEHDDRGNAPRHAQHGQCRASAIVPHSSVGFLKQVAKHFPIPAAALRRAEAWRLYERGRGRQ